MKKFFPAVHTRVTSLLPPDRICYWVKNEVDEFTQSVNQEKNEGQKRVKILEEMTAFPSQCNVILSEVCN